MVYHRNIHFVTPFLGQFFIIIIIIERIIKKLP